MYVNVDIYKSIKHEGYEFFKLPVRKCEHIENRLNFFPNLGNSQQVLYSFCTELKIELKSECLRLRSNSGVSDD